MKKLTFVLIFLFLTSFVNAAEVILTPTLPQTTTPISTSTESVFTRSLTTGSYGSDVMALKKILSLELKTTQETGAAFTTNTASDVKKLQEKYAVEVLIPNGLSSGTGYVGPATIKKLNQLAPTYFIKISDFVAPILATTTSTIKNTFVSTLKLGSLGEEVVLLKTILNADPSTALSPKNSTMIYDLATQIAVNKFQEKYASEILTPSGLTSGTGIVGPATRKKLNFLLNQTLVSVGISVATTSIQTTPTKQVFTVSGSLGGISGSLSANLTDGDISGSYCEGTTLVVTKIGFGSTYTTRTTNSSECNPTSNNYLQYGTNINDFGICKKTAYTVGPWSACKTNSDTTSIDALLYGNSGIQTRTVTAGAVSTTTCPYYDVAPATSRSCQIPECSDSEDIAFVGQVATLSGCLITAPAIPLSVYTIKAGATYSNHQGTECRYTPKYILQFNPLIGGIAGTFSNAPDKMNIIGDISTAKATCVVLGDSFEARILKPDTKIKIGD